MNVESIMSTELITLSMEDDLTDVLEGMEKLRVRHLPVVDGAKLVGLLSQRDVLRLSRDALSGAPGATEKSRRLESSFIYDVMTRDVVTGHRDTSVSEAARLMVTGRFGCLPIVDDENNLIGIVTETDLLAHLAGVDLTETQRDEPPRAAPTKPLRGDA